MTLARAFRLSLGSLALTAFFVLSQPLLADTIPRFPDPTIDSLDSGYCALVTTGRFDPFLEAIALHSASGNRHLQQRVLDWLESFAGRLSFEQASRAYEAVLSTASDPNSLSRARRLLGHLRLAQCSRLERTLVYERALTAGSTITSDGFYLSDSQAMRMAAMDGIESVRDHLLSEAARERASAPYPRFSAAQQSLQYLRFRTGALDRDDALGFHLRALLDMPVADFHELLRNDSAFGSMAFETATDACHRTSSRHCSLVAEICTRWRAFAPDPSPSEDPLRATALPNDLIEVFLRFCSLSAPPIPCDQGSRGLTPACSGLATLAADARR